MDSGKSSTKALVAGVDGCRDGWIYLVAEAGPGGPQVVEIGVGPTFEDLTEALNACAVVSLDMPIGFSEDGVRLADIEARRLIGPRRSSVFPPPPRALLMAGGDYWALNALSRSIRAGLPRQTYNLLPKMREIDAAMTPALQARIRESHPEVSFCALKADCLQHGKRSREGRLERLYLLARVFGPVVRDWRPPRGAALDDLYDAAVLAWTAARIARGEARTLAPEPEVDAKGLRMEIVY